MFVLWKKIEFYKGQRDCEAIVIIAWGLGKSPDGEDIKYPPYVKHFQSCKINYPWNLISLNYPRQFYKTFISV